MMVFSGFVEFKAEKLLRMMISVVFEEKDLENLSNFLRRSSTRENASSNEKKLLAVAGQVVSTC